MHKKVSTKAGNCSLYCGEKLKENDTVYQCWQCGFESCENCFKHSLDKTENVSHEHPLKAKFNQEEFNCSKCKVNKKSTQFACNNCAHKLCLKCKFE